MLTTRPRRLSNGWIAALTALALAPAACGGSKNGITATTSAGSGGGATGTGTGGSSTATVGSGGGSTTAGTGAGTSTTASTGGTTTGTAGTSTGSGTGGGQACTPTPGTATLMMGCQTLELAVLQHSGAPSDLRLTGTLFSDGATTPTCAAIDGVDILSGGVGSTVVQHLDGGLTLALGQDQSLIAQGSPPVADISNRCASDDPAQRFGVYGIVITGHADGGTFTAQCALAAQDTQWPPALRVTCHDNLDLPPQQGDASVMSGSVMGMTFATSQLFANAPHDPGGALDSIGGTLHVIAQRAPFDTGAPIPSHDVPGWMTAVSETVPPSPPMSQMSFFAGSNLLGSDLCPPAPPNPPPLNYVPPPVFLLRATGTGQHGSFSTEIFFPTCYAEAGP
jgi:hypothetical protein